jgi:hypothetical protein
MSHSGSDISAHLAAILRWSSFALRRWLDVLGNNLRMVVTHNDSVHRVLSTIVFKVELSRCHPLCSFLTAVDFALDPTHVVKFAAAVSTRCVIHACSSVCSVLSDTERRAKSGAAASETCVSAEKRSIMAAPHLDRPDSRDTTDRPAVRALSKRCDLSRYADCPVIRIVRNSLVASQVVEPRCVGSVGVLYVPGLPWFPCGNTNPPFLAPTRRAVPPSRASKRVGYISRIPLVI